MNYEKKLWGSSFYFVVTMDTKCLVFKKNQNLKKVISKPNSAVQKGLKYINWRNKCHNVKKKWLCGSYCMLGKKGYFLKKLLYFFETFFFSVCAQCHVLSGCTAF